MYGSSGETEETGKGILRMNTGPHAEVHVAKLDWRILASSRLLLDVVIIVVIVILLSRIG
jgi:hypothetical protein